MWKFIDTTFITKLLEGKSFGRLSICKDIIKMNVISISYNIQIRSPGLDEFVVVIIGIQIFYESLFIV
jgi:hypothetical protein